MPQRHPSPSIPRTNADGRNESCPCAAQLRVDLGGAGDFLALVRPSLSTFCLGATCLAAAGSGIGGGAASSGEVPAGRSPPVSLPVGRSAWPAVRRLVGKSPKPIRKEDL